MHWLFDSTEFVTRNHCGAWTPTLIAVNRISNLLVFLAYFTIPLVLFYLWQNVRRNDAIRETIGRYPSIILCFVVFIFSCGLTHLCDVFAFDWAPYRLFTLIDLVTASVSVGTAILLPGVIKDVIDGSNDGR